MTLEIYAEDDSLTKPFTLIPTASAASKSSVLALAEKSTGIENTASLKSGLIASTVALTYLKNRNAKAFPLYLTLFTTISRSVPRSDLNDVMI